MPERDQPLSHVAESRAVARKRARLSVVWLVPIVAALAGVWVAVTKIRSEGPKMTIVVQSTLQQPGFPYGSGTTASTSAASRRSGCRTITNA